MIGERPKYDILQHDLPVQGSKRTSVMVRSPQGIEMRLGNGSNPVSEDSLLIQLSPEDLALVVSALQQVEESSVEDDSSRARSKLVQRLSTALQRYQLIRADWIGAVQ